MTATVELAVEIQQESLKAFLVHDGTRHVWVPKSLIEDPDEVECPSRCCAIVVAEWFAHREGLI